jgi:nucleotide-binding universal stress UspA family protein
MIEFKHILVPTDFGEASSRAVEVAVDLAGKYGSALTLFHVCEFPVYGYPGLASGVVDLSTAVQQAAQRELDTALAALRSRMPSATGLLAIGVPWQEIQRAIEARQADLVVLGTHGRRGLSRALLGSVAQRTVQMSQVPVLTVRGPAAP